MRPRVGFDFHLPRGVSLTSRCWSPVRGLQTVEASCPSESHRAMADAGWVFDPKSLVPQPAARVLPIRVSSHHRPRWHVIHGPRGQIRVRPPLSIVGVAAGASMCNPWMKTRLLTGAVAPSVVPGCRVQSSESAIVSAADKPGPCPFDVDPARGPRLRNPGPFRVRAPTHTFPAEEFKSHRFLLRRCGG